MGRTYAKKLEAREARLRGLPQAERLVKNAMIKKKEGRVLDAAEKHALRMTSEQGDILRLWEKLRTTTSSDEDNISATTTAVDKRHVFEHKYPLVDQLLGLIEPKFATYARTPRVSRVLQSMIKYGSSEHLTRIYRSLSQDFAGYATDAYAHFVLCALTRHAPHELYKKILHSTLPVVPSLISHKYGVAVLHGVYSSHWCNPADRDLLLLATMKDDVAMMRQWVGYPVLSNVLTQNPQLRKRLLTRLFDLSDRLVSVKGVIGYPIVQCMVYTFLRHGTRNEVSELCDTLRPHLGAIATSPEGAPLASLVFALTEPKRRKEILHGYKSILIELATGKYSAPVVARLFDFMYDPQLAQKYVVKDLTANLDVLLASPHGYLILMHLLTPDSSRKWRFLLPHWRAHNLYAADNVEWNQHTWLSDSYEEETVQVCDKDAMNSHLAVVPTLVRGMLAYVASVEKEQGAMPRILHHHVALLARETRLVAAAHPAYRTALQLSTEEDAVLRRLSPAEGHKRAHSPVEAAAAPSVEAENDTTTSKQGARIKKRRVETMPRSKRASSAAHLTRAGEKASRATTKKQVKTRKAASAAM